MATTTNFNWETPDDTDLVKDGAAAIRTALNGVDTSFVDLKGGTTGQVLSKASNTDLDFTWATDASGIPATIFDAKGDIIAATAADTASRLAVGANNTVLTADSATASGLTFIKSQTIGSAVTSVTVTGAFSATYDNYLITVSGGVGSQSSNTVMTLGSTTANYYLAGYYMAYTSSTVNGFNLNNGSGWNSTYYSTAVHSGHIQLQNPFLSKNTIFDSLLVTADSTSYIARYAGFLNDTTSYTAFTLTRAGGTMTGGEIRVYGYQNS